MPEYTFYLLISIHPYIHIYTTTYKKPPKKYSKIPPNPIPPPRPLDPIPHGRLTQQLNLSTFHNFLMTIKFLQSFQSFPRLMELFFVFSLG